MDSKRRATAGIPAGRYLSLWEYRLEYIYLGQRYPWPVSFYIGQ